MINLRPYQINLKNKVLKAWEAGSRRVMMQLPTGGGKTAILSNIVNLLETWMANVLILVHRKELVDQIYESLCKVGVYAGVIQADHKVSNYDLQTQVASIQTLVNRPKPKADYIIIDEAHHTTENGQYGEILKAYPNAKVLGVTATPIRLDGKGFVGIFDELVTEITVQELMAQGYLSDFEVYSKPIDLKGVKVRMGDYQVGQLGQKMNTSELVGDLVSTWVKYAYQKRTIVFAVNVEHSLSIVDSFKKYGVKAAHIDGSTSKVVREAALEAFKAGEIQILSNCNIVSEGFDVPACECVQLARPTKSLNLYLQQIGRALRPFPGKDKAIILDHGNLVDTHGMPDFPFIWTLNGVVKHIKSSSPSDTKPKENAEIISKEIKILNIELIKRDRSIHHDPYTDRFVERYRAALSKGWKPIAAYYQWLQNDMRSIQPSMDQLKTVAKYLGYKPGWAHIAQTKLRSPPMEKKAM